MGIRDSGQHNPVLVAVMLVLVSCPERGVDRTAFFHRKTDYFVPQLLLVVHAVFPLRHNHLDSVDVLLQQEVLLTDQLVREIHEGVLVEVCVQLPSWLPPSARAARGSS